MFNFIRNICFLLDYLDHICIFITHTKYFGLAVNGHQLNYLEIDPIEITISKMHFY